MNTNPSPAEKRKRGRPRKNALSAPPPVQDSQTQRRRGRPPKNQSTYKTGTPGSYRNLQGHISKMATPPIETWEFEYPGSNTDLVIRIPEFTCVCPKTGLPDFAEIVIEYRPQKQCIELKSLKEYILFYRNVGIFHEHVVNRILRDLAKACKPASMTVTGIFNARGGIQTTVQATL